MGGPPSLRGPSRLILRLAAGGLVALAAASASWPWGARQRPHLTPSGGLERLVVGTPWPEWRRELVVTDPQVLRPMEAAAGTAARRPARPATPVWPVWRLSLQWASGAARDLWVLTDGRLWDPARSRPVAAPAAVAAARQAVAAFGQHLFGDAVPWDQVHPLFPLDGEATLEDVRTGVSLRVKRYGGHLHADVEPATSRDTAVLRALYGGRWSWRRRPVVAIVGGRRLAASINGMPHGAGVVRDNDFPGHFCLHFLQSRIHRTGRVDPSHQLMVWEAAGRLAERLEQASPGELATWALAALNEADEAALSLATVGWDPELASRLMADLRHVVLLEARTAEPESPGQPAAVDLELLVYYTGHRPDTGFRRTLRLTLRPRPHRLPAGGWAVALSELASLLELPASGSPAVHGLTEQGC